MCRRDLRDIHGPCRVWLIVERSHLRWKAGVFPLQGPVPGEEEVKEDGEVSQSSLVSPPGSPVLDRKLTSHWNQMDTKVRENMIEVCIVYVGCSVIVCTYVTYIFALE